MKKLVLVSSALSLAIWLIVQNRKRAPLSLGWSTRQRVGGTLDQLQGATKHAVGTVLGNNALTTQGLVQEVAGSVRRSAGKAVAKFGDALRS